MKESKQNYQCQCCGNIHPVDNPGKLYDSIYYEIWCKNCGATKHLRIGSTELEKYELMNNFLDERYFSYNT